MNIFNPHKYEDSHRKKPVYSDEQILAMREEIIRCNKILKSIKKGGKSI